MKNQKILIPIGQSFESRHILSYIPRFFPPEGTELVLIQVAEKPEEPIDAAVPKASVPNALTAGIHYLMRVRNPTPSSGVDDLVSKDVEPTVYASQVEARRRYEVQDALKKIAEPLREDGYDVSTVVRFGKPAEGILTYLEAEEEAFDLIAMTTHCRSGLDRLLRGSVAEDVLRNTHMPALLVQPPAGD